MLQPPDVFSTKLFVDSSVAEEFECAICNNAFKDPVQACKNGHTFCRGCLHEAMQVKNECPNCSEKLTPESIVPSLTTKNLMGKAPVYCFTRLPTLDAVDISTRSNAGSTDVDADDDDNDEAGAAAASSGKRKSSSSSSSSSGGAAAEKKYKPDSCTWTGKLNDAAKHFNECPHAGVVCRLGCGEIVKRIDTPEHEASVCPKRRAVPCTNAGCTDVIPAPLLAAHKADDCLYQTVECPFKSVGCTERLLRKDIKNHTDTMANQHMLMMLQDNRSLRQNNQSLQQKVSELEQSIKQEDDELVKDDRLQQQLDGQEARLIRQEERLNRQEERLNRQPQEIVVRVNVAELLRVGEVEINSELQTVGAHTVHVCVKKGFDPNGCGVFLFFDDGPFPCRVSFTLEAVHWDGNLASVCKCEITHTYEWTCGCGRPNMVPLSQIIAVASPYVKDGRVTFIARFQILPMA